MENSDAILKSKSKKVGLTVKTKHVVFASIIVISLMLNPAFAQSVTKTAQEKQDERLKTNCEKIQKVSPNTIPKYCAKYGIETPTQLPKDPIEYQKQQLQQKIKDLWTRFSAEVEPKRADLGEEEYMKQYNELQKQTESLELKLQALDSGRTAPQEEAINNCAAGKVADAFGNCVTPQQKKMSQMKGSKGVPAEMVDDTENLKTENAALKSRVDALEKKVASLESIIKQLQAAIAKITG